MPSAARDTWSCDFCGTVGFHSFEEANDHEHECQQTSARKRQRPGSPGRSSGMAPLHAAVAEERDYDQSARRRMRRIAIMAPDEIHHHQMDISDVLACQNLEVFEAGTEFEGDSRIGQVAPGQVGIRCIHCVHQPTNEFNMYFPGSIQAMGSAIQMVVDRHVIHCPAAPDQACEELQRAYEKRRRFREESRSDDVWEERNRMALMAYCSIFCRNCSIIDRYPPESGLSFADRYPPSFEAPYLPGQLMAQMLGDTIAATPLARSSKDHDRSGLPSGYAEREGSHSGYPTPYAVGGPRGMYPEGMSVQTPHTRSDTESEGPLSQHGLPPHESPGPAYHPYGPSPFSMSPTAHQVEYPFYQDANGSWACRYCNSHHPQYRDHGATWNGPEPPPSNFINQHLHVCRAYNHAVMPSSGMYQGHLPPAPGYSSYPLPPNYSGQGPPRGHGMGTPGVPTHVSAMQSHYSTPHSNAPYYYHPGPDERHPSMPSRPVGLGERHNMGASRAPRPPPSRRIIVASHSGGGDMAAQQAIEYLDAVDRRDSADGGDFGSELDQLVLEEDKMLLTDYFYYLMKQLKVCRFSETDRKTRGGKRENIAVGYGGLQCIHCAETPNARKFFWSNVDRLANSFAEIPFHVLKCRHCPNETKQAIEELKIRHPDQMGKLPRGSQKVFFRRMWRRLHDGDPKPEGALPDEKEPDEEGRAIEEIQHPPGEQKMEAASPFSQNLETMAPSPGTSTDESVIMLERPTDEAAKVLAASAGASHSDPPSPSSRVLLGIPEDKEWLSDMDCFVRHNLEVFCATQEDVDVAQQDRKYPVNIGQVGIRCIHCGLAKDGEGARGSAVAYPYSISGIYESVREFQRLHLDSCTNLPPATKQKLAGFKGSSSLSSVLRKYYVLAAKALGMYDTPDGIRSGAEPVPLGPTAAFTFAEATSKVSEEMWRGGVPRAAFAETGLTVTPLESRKRRQSEEPSGNASEGEPTMRES